MSDVKKQEADKRQRVEVARGQGFTGSMCPDCGNFQMVRNGTCEKCTVCGSTTGCS